MMTYVYVVCLNDVIRKTERKKIRSCVFYKKINIFSSVLRQEWLQADDKTNVGRSVGIIKIIISNSRAGKKILI